MKENDWEVIRQSHKKWKQERRERNIDKMKKWLDKNGIEYELMLELGKSSIWKNGHLIGYISMSTNVNEPLNVRLKGSVWMKMRKPNFVKHYKSIKVS